MVMSGWRVSKRGNYWGHADDGRRVTVWETVDGTWRWVIDGEFDDEDFPSPHEAMTAVEEELRSDAAT